MLTHLTGVVQYQNIFRDSHKEPVFQHLREISSVWFTLVPWCFLPLHRCIGVPRKQTNNGGREKQTNNKPWYFARLPHPAVVSAPASVFSCPTRKAFLNKNYSSIWLELVASKNMLISLILTSFDHFQFSSTLGMYHHISSQSVLDFEPTFQIFRYCRLVTSLKYYSNGSSCIKDVLLRFSPCFPIWHA